MKWVRRILIWIVAVVVLVVLGLWLAGFRKGAGINSATIDINRPPAQVWRYLTNDDLVKKWVSGLTEIRHLTPGVEGVGNRFEMTVVMDGERTDMEMEITAFVPNRQIGFKVKSIGHPSMGFTETGEYAIVEQDRNTLLTLTGRSRYFPFWLQLLEPLITSSAQKKLVGDLARLKSLVEAEPRMAATP